jgi:dynein heavy chain
MLYVYGCVQVIVDAKTLDVEGLIRDIADRQRTVDLQNEEAQKKQVELQESAKVIEVESAKANEALEEAVPALEAAAEALDNLDKNDIVEIRSFAQPPPLVMMVCMCVLHLRPTGREDESAMWKGAKAMMSDVGFLKALKEYQKDNIKEKQVGFVGVQSGGCGVVGRGGEGRGLMSAPQSGGRVVVGKERVAGR